MSVSDPADGRPDFLASSPALVGPAADPAPRPPEVPPAPAARRRSRRPPHPLAVLTVCLLLLAALAVVGDGVARVTAEHRAAADVQTRLGSRSTPRISIGGLAFVPQVLANRYSSVHVAADVVHADPLVLTQLDLTLHDASLGAGRTVTSRKVDGSAVLGWTSAGTVAGVPLNYAGNGRLATRFRTSVFGIPETLTISARPQLDVANQSVLLVDLDVRAGNYEIPPNYLRGLDRLLRPLPLTGVPYGLRVSRLTPENAGLLVGLTGTDVTFS